QIGDSEHDFSMRLDQLLEGAHVAALRPQHELLLGAWTALHSEYYTASPPGVPADGRVTLRRDWLAPGTEAGGKKAKGCTQHEGAAADRRPAQDMRSARSARSGRRGRSGRWRLRREAKLPTQ